MAVRVKRMRPGKCLVPYFVLRLCLGRAIRRPHSLESLPELGLTCDQRTVITLALHPWQQKWSHYAVEVTSTHRVMEPLCSAVIPSTARQVVEERRHENRGDGFLAISQTSDVPVVTDITYARVHTVHAE